jgi:hypothetical protein
MNVNNEIIIRNSVGQNFENFENFRKIPIEFNFRKMVKNFIFSKIYSKKKNKFHEN